MSIRKILTILIYLIIAMIFIVGLVYLSLESNFAKVKSIKEGSAFDMKANFYEEMYHSKRFKRDLNNENLLSLGEFTVNINNNIHDNKLLMKVSIQTQDQETIKLLMNTQAVIRNDVIESIMNIKSSNVNSKSVSKEIKNALNKRLKKDIIQEVYLEKFIIQ